MKAAVSDIFNDLSYYSLFDVAEKARWYMKDIAWDSIDKSLINQDMLDTVKRIVYGELTTFSATKSFMSMFEDDIDFTQWLAVWLYEETKHPHVLTKWLALNDVKLTGDFLLEGRAITPMTESRIEMLTFNVISEIVAGNFYIATSEKVPEPVLKDICYKLGKDEMRHSVGFENFAKLTIQRAEDPDYEQLIVVRSAWVFLNGQQFIDHPVFQTVTSVDSAFSETVTSKIRKQIASRIGKLAGVEIPDPDKIYDVYTKMKLEYRAKKKAEKKAAVALAD